MAMFNSYVTNYQRVTYMGYFIYNLDGIFHRFNLSLHRLFAGSRLRGISLGDMDIIVIELDDGKMYRKALFF